MPPMIPLLLSLTPAGPAWQEVPQLPARSYELLGATSAQVLHDWDGDGGVDLVAFHGITDLVSATPGAEGGTFGQPVEVATMDVFLDHASGDVDGDGELDVAFLDAASGSDLVDLVVLFADGSGGFNAVRNRISSSPDQPVALALTHLDADGHLDLVLAVQPPDATEGWVNSFLGTGTGTFVPAASDVPVGRLPRRVVAADWDEDGAVDLAVACSGSQDVTVLLGDGLGGLAPGGSFAEGTQTYNLAPADFDGDGHLDLAVGRTPSAPLLVLFGDGQGGFAVTSFGASAHRFAVAAADVDGDGAPDVISGNAEARVFYNDGAGGFVTETVFDNLSTSSVDAADLDGDGVAEVLVGSVWGYLTLFADGDGNLTPPQELDGGGNWTAPGDFNGDGLVDVATDVSNTLFPSGDVAIRLADGAGGFDLTGSASTAVIPIAGAALDLDLDGALDLATANTETPTFMPPVHGLSLLAGNGSGGFTGVQELVLDEAPTGIVAADWNGDGIDDLAVSTVGAVDVYAGDGLGGLGAAQAVPVVGSVLAVTAADLNLDGVLDLASASAGAVTVHLGDGAGGWSPGIVTPGTLGARVLKAATWDDDPFPDLVVLDGGAVFTEGPTLKLFHGAGDGSFGTPEELAVPLPALGTVGGLGVQDIDGDGRLDALAIAEDLYLIRGTSAGGLGELETHYLPGAGQDVVLGDWDADGFVDLFCQAFSSVWVVSNRDVAPRGVRPFGSGTPGCNGPHLALTDAPPVLGTTLNLTCNQAPPGGLGVRFGSIGSNASGLLLAGVQVHVDPFALGFFMKPATADAAGLARETIVLPGDAILAGLEFHEQFAWFWTAGPCSPSDLSLSTSRGVTLTLE